MIHKRDTIANLLTSFPGFIENWNAHQLFWEEEDAGLCNDLGEFQRYIESLFLVAEPPLATIAAAFILVEKLLREGDQEVQNAAATCFLENFLNRGFVSTDQFINHLGPKSYAYCRAWDEFTGVDSDNSMLESSVSKPFA